MKKLLTVLLLLSLLCAPAFAESERRVVEYTVVWAGRDDGLIDRVNAMILKGWEPLGGVCIPSNTGPRYQAMVKYEEVEE